MSYLPIEDHGIIGDLKTVALVGLDGTIDFFCFPRFDSPSVFGALLDDKIGGKFCIAPDFEARHTQLYVPDTNVLLTRFMAKDGILEVTDFMPLSADHDQPSRIVRIVRSVQGTIPVSLYCKPGFDYARAGHSISIEKDGEMAVFTSGNTEQQGLNLSSCVALRQEDGAVRANFTLKTGEEAFFMLNCACARDDGFTIERVHLLERETFLFWRGWVSQITYKKRWRHIVNRSALTLKLMSSRQYGSVIAAPTFGLPEAMGGTLNWDYRYCWIRDSAFTIYAFVRLGLREEAIDFMRWVEKMYEKSASHDGKLQLMYRVDGSEELDEKEMDQFEGYQYSRPVRIGNEAHKQFQLDIYGELMDAVAMSDMHITKISYDAWQNVIKTADYVCDHWKKPDQGIWEFRGKKREFLHSRLMCWVALDRALRLAREESLPSEIKRWLDARADIYNDIFENFWDEDMKCFVQYKGAKVVDASVLLMPLVQFIGAEDPRWLSTLDEVGKRLAHDSLVKRYRQDDADSESKEEGSFNACSFWYISCLARSGKGEEARLLFSKMLSYANHLGLYAEETAVNGRQLGNFPQALTHLSLINAVFALEEAGNPERAPIY